MKNYLNLLQDILDNGANVADRTGVGRRRVFGRQLRFKVADGFAIPTTRKIYLRSVVEELLWFIAGGSNNKDLNDKNVHIWDQWAVKEEDIVAFVDKFYTTYPASTKEGLVDQFSEDYLGSIGNLYGKAWRSAPGNLIEQSFVKAEIAPDKLIAYTKMYQDDEVDDISLDEFIREQTCHEIDQLQQVIVGLKNKPFSSRHVISAWIPSFIPSESFTPQENVLMGYGALAPCHCMFQFHAEPPEVEGGKNRLSLMLTQRSNDVAVGSALNSPSYMLLLMMVAQVTGMEAYEFIYSMGDAHVYLNQIDLVKEQLKREPLPLPTMHINPDVTSIYDFKLEDFELEGYNPLPAIKYPVAM